MMIDVRKPAAAIGSAVFFVAAPVVVAGLGPWLVTGWRLGRVWLPAQVLGVLLVLVAAIAGQALIFGRAGLWIYTGVAWLCMAAFVWAYEEPTLRRRFGAEYEAYRRAVPGWLPRWRPWRPEDA